MINIDTILHDCFVEDYWYKQDDHMSLAFPSHEQIESIGHLGNDNTT